MRAAPFLHELPDERSPLLANALSELGARGRLCAATREALLALGRSCDGLVPPASTRPYARRTLIGNETGEVMLASWTAHVRCAPHDHGGSGGIVLVVEGVFEERTYAFDDVRLIERERTRRVRGDAIAVSATSIHDMGCLGEGGITLHVYAPSPKPMRVYDEVRRETAIVGDGHGAWLPASDASEVERIPWQTRAKP